MSFCCLFLKTASFSSSTTRSILNYSFICLCIFFTLLFCNSQHQNGNLKYVFPSVRQKVTQGSICIFRKRDMKGKSRRHTRMKWEELRNAQVKLLTSLVSRPTPMPPLFYTYRETHTTSQMSVSQVL